MRPDMTEADRERYIADIRAAMPAAREALRKGRVATVAYLMGISEEEARALGCTDEPTEVARGRGTPP